MSSGAASASATASGGAGRRALQEGDLTHRALGLGVIGVGVEDRLVGGRAPRRSRRRPDAHAPAPTRGRPARAVLGLRRSSLPAVAFSSESIQRRNCSGGCGPWKLDSGWPAARATTVGTACTPNICATRGVVSTFTVASAHLPPSACGQSRQRVAQLHAGSLRGDHSSTTTGTSLDRTSTSASKLASVTSTPPGAAGPAARALARRRGRLLESGEVNRAGQRRADGRAGTCHALKSVTSFRTGRPEPVGRRPSRTRSGPSDRPI